MTASITPTTAARQHKIFSPSNYYSTASFQLQTLNSWRSTPNISISKLQWNPFLSLWVCPLWLVPCSGGRRICVFRFWLRGPFADWDSSEYLVGGFPSHCSICWYRSLCLSREGLGGARRSPTAITLDDYYTNHTIHIWYTHEQCIPQVQTKDPPLGHRPLTSRHVTPTVMGVLLILYLPTAVTPSDTSPDLNSSMSRVA